jgi:hypothetical protein
MTFGNTSQSCPTIELLVQRYRTASSAGYIDISGLRVTDSSRPVDTDVPRETGILVCRPSAGHSDAEQDIDDGISKAWSDMSDPLEIKEIQEIKNKKRIFCSGLKIKYSEKYSCLPSLNGLSLSYFHVAVAR